MGIQSARKKNKNTEQFRSILDEKLGHMKDLISTMGTSVEKTISDAQFIIMNPEQANEKLVIMKQREFEINTLQLKLSKACFRGLARQAPVAKDLRLILTCIYASIDLERMGDLAINIAHKSQRMEIKEATQPCHDLLNKMFQSTIEMVRLTLKAFINEDLQLSKDVLAMDDIVDSWQIQIKKQSQKMMKDHNHLIPTGVEFIVASSGLERIADHSTNIAEDIIFLNTGYDVRHGGE